MKKIVFILLMVVSISCYAQSDKTFNLNEGVYTSVRQSTRAAKDTLVTRFNWQDSKGNKYPIIVRKENGYAYVWKVSGKTGKGYRYAVPEEIAKDVCSKINIKYTYVKKSNKK